MTDNSVTKAAACRQFGWTRYQFDCLVREGMPVISGAEHKGAQWAVDPKAVEKWLRARAARAELRRQAEAQRAAEWRAEAERREADRLAAHREQERRKREAEERRIAEIVAEREAEERNRALRDCYSAVFRLAMVAYGVVTGPGWPDRPENQAFFHDWPSGARGGPPDWWHAPPGMLEFALAERRRVSVFGEPEPDWSQFLKGYKFGTPWPWRREAADA